MENPPELQLFRALVFASAGIAAGLLYDVGRALRRVGGSKTALWTDSLFTVLVGAGLFVLAMARGGGQLRIYMLAAWGCGWAGYSRLCSRWVVPGLVRALKISLGTVGKLWAGAASVMRKYRREHEGKIWQRKK